MQLLIPQGVVLIALLALWYSTFCLNQNRDNVRGKASEISFFRTTATSGRGFTVNYSGFTSEYM